MSYQTYTTKAIVCGAFNRNTADCSYLLFTREAGMLYADARSVREERSRQRYALQEFSLIRVSLVKGKNSWKVGSIEALKNYYHESSDKLARGSVASLVRLLRRFLKGEEADPETFDYVVAALEELITDINKRQFVLMAIQVHLLASLGYVDFKSLPPILKDISPQEIKNHHTAEIEKRINDLYTHAVSMSHL